MKGVGLGKSLLTFYTESLTSSSLKGKPSNAFFKIQFSILFSSLLKYEQGPIFLIKGVFPYICIDNVDLGSLDFIEALFIDNDFEVISSKAN